MATRKQIREAFYSELETAASGLVAPDNIGEEYPNAEEDLPAIVHTDNYREIPMNFNTGVVDTQTTNGGVTAEIYVELIQAQFSILVASDDEGEKEDMYEAVRSYFGDYKFPIKDISSLHSDAFNIEVEDSTSQDDEDRDPPLRGDRLNINIDFQRFYTKDTTPVDQVALNVDADNDNITDITYTTT